MADGMASFAVNTIYQESCLDTLARMPDGFLDCVVTSPPYYGLRSYGTEPQIWGGEKDCRHIFVSTPVKDSRGTNGTTLSGRDPNQVENRLNYEYAFCSVCNAWRGELGLEPTFQLYISHLIDIFREVYRVLKPSGSVWVNLGDSYAGSWGAMSHSLDGKAKTTGANGRPNTSRPQGLRSKSLMNIPARFAIAMTDELQFIQRNEIIWRKKSCMPESVKDRFTRDFEPVFFFVKSERYYFEQQLEKTLTFDGGLRDRDNSKLNKTPGRTRMAGLVTNAYEMRNKRTVWDLGPEGSEVEHYASYPTKLIEVPIRAGCPVGGIVYDPFGGTATTAVVSYKLGRDWIISELNPKYVEIAEKRLKPYLDQPTMF